jgi:hypothetical protein
MNVAVWLDPTIVQGRQTRRTADGETYAPGTSRMNAIGRRLSKLAATLLPQPDTWQMQQLRQRMEAGRKRVGAMYGERMPLA